MSPAIEAKECDADNWHMLWDSFQRHQTTDIRVERGALSDVCQCHGGAPRGLVTVEPMADSLTVVVSRARLFDFLKAHGHACGLNAPMGDAA